MISQYEQMTAYLRSNVGRVPDVATRQKYFTGQRELNAKLVKTAPASLANDIALLSRNANGSYDAQLRGDRKSMMAAIAPMRRPDHLAAARRANAYCGVTATK